MFPTIASLADRSSRGGKATSPLLPAGTALILCFSLSLAAIVSDSLPVLLLLSLADAIFLLLCRIHRKSAWRAGKLFLWQTTCVTGLYLLRFGVAEGLWPGLRVSWKLTLAFIPGMGLAQGIPQNGIEKAMARLLPQQTAFALTMSIKFLPLLVREIRAIYEAQVLRGAHILPRDLWRWRNWSDFFHCLIAPSVVQAMLLAENIAQAARSREFGRHPRRTIWPG
ncbi:MAG: hypothetical protein GX751_02780 [Desulfuromonadaceae bacterium]|nr:hypothetical protein [Desulfuromonadaceae bacterium]